jgi:hypothetical protein
MLSLSLSYSIISQTFTYPIMSALPACTAHETKQPDFPKYCIISDTTHIKEARNLADIQRKHGKEPPALNLARAWAKKNGDPQWVAVEQVGGLFATVVTDGKSVWYGTDKSWITDKTDEVYKTFKMNSLEKRIKLMFKDYEGVGIKYLVMYGEWFGNGISIPLIKLRDFNVVDICVIDEMGTSFLTHGDVISTCNKFQVRAAEEAFAQGTLQDMIMKCKLDTKTMSRINTDMVLHGVYFKPVGSRPRSVPLLVRISLCCVSMPVAARFDVRQHQKVEAIIQLITSKRVYEIMGRLGYDPTSDQWDVTKMAKATIVDVMDELVERGRDDLFEGMSGAKQTQVYDYLTHYTESIVRRVFRAHGVDSV